MSEPKDAPSPFHAQARKADIILRTTDNVDFHVCKAILAYACGFFEGLFGDAGGTDADEMKDGRRVVPLQDESGDLEPFLRFVCRTADPPTFTSPEHIVRVHSLTCKYVVDEELIPAFESAIILSSDSEPNIESQPGLYYCAGVQIKSKRVAQDAARKCLSRDYRELVREVITNDMTADLKSVAWLLTYHEATGLAIGEHLGTNSSWWKLVTHGMFHRVVVVDVHDDLALLSLPDPGNFTTYHPWARNFVQDLIEPLKQRPCSATIREKIVLLNRYFKSPSSCSECERGPVTVPSSLVDLLCEQVDSIASKKANDLSDRLPVL